MKFNIGDEVVELASGNKCIIVGTKESSWKTTVHPYNLKEIFPQNNADYIVLIRVGENEFKGEMHVYESQLSQLFPK